MKFNEFQQFAVSTAKSLDEYIAEITSSSDEGITSSIRDAMYQLVLNQAVEALKDLAMNSAAMFKGEFEE